MVGRMFIVKNETQVFCDSASLRATKELDGTVEGLARARISPASNRNRWYFGTLPFTSYSVSFAKEKEGPWEANPPDAKDYTFANVDANVSMPLFFMPVVTTALPALPWGAAFLNLSSFTTSIRGRSAANQQPKTGFREGLFPFSPFAHDDDGPHFGLVPGQRYTLRWASNPKLNNNVCPGDNLANIIELAGAGGGEERGYIEERSSAVIRRAIEGDYQIAFREIGDSVEMTGGAKQTQLTSIINRVQSGHGQYLAQLCRVRDRRPRQWPADCRSAHQQGKSKLHDHANRRFLPAPRIRIHQGRQRAVLRRIRRCVGTGQPFQGRPRVGRTCVEVG